MNPAGTLSVVADDGDIDLPVDLGRVVGDLYFEPTVFASSIVVISEARMLSLREASADTSRPKYAAVRYKQAVGSHGQTQELLLWPIPDAAYTLTYRYEAYSGKLSAQNPCPLGGARYAELVTESCLAIAEQRANDEKGIHTERFFSLLASGIAMDRRSGGRFYGSMAGPDESVLGRRDVRQTTYPITYKGETW
jgi:hypothetical protein